MFQNLSQGAIIPVLYKNEPKVIEGKVLSVNTHMPVYNPAKPMAMLNGPVTDITVQVENDTIPFAELPASGITANFQDKGIFLSTDMSAMVKEVESIMNMSEQAIKQAPIHEKRIKICKDLLVKLQPEKAKEALQAQEIENLKSQLSQMSGKFDKFMDMFSAKFGNQNKED